MLLKVGGSDNQLRILNASVFILVSILNTVTSIILGDELSYYLGYSSFFLLLGIIAFFVKNKKIIALIYFMIGQILILTANKGEFSGAVFIIYSVYLFKHNNFNIIALIVSILSIAGSSFISHRTPFQTILISIVYAFIYLIYFFTIRSDQKKHDTPDVAIPDIYISPDEKHLIELLFAGYTRQEIYTIMEKSKTSINSYQNNLLVKLQAKTFEEVLLKLGKSVKIKGNSQHADN